ncbi:unnamed protein product [Sphagnum troendelagicum]|uniref:Uncharacterized protein n=1 Tax=Sphagnum troendelagicum TaxID=128251 RepID=A0ABP0UIW6_9BRYO
MLQVEGCNQTEVPLVGPISCRMESSFCRDVLCGPLGPIKSLSLAIDVKVAGVTIHMYLGELAALSEILNCSRIAFTDGFLSRPRSMGGEGSISAFTDEDRSAPSEVCESLDSANSEIFHPTGGGESSRHTSAENMLLGLFALSVNAQLEAFQVAFGGHRQLEEKDSSSSSREASKIAALVVTKDSSSTSKPEVGNGRNRDNTAREIATSGWNIQLPGARKGPGAYLVTKVFSLDLLLGDGHDSHLFADLDGGTAGVVSDGVLSPEPPKRELRRSHQLSSLDHSSNMASDSIQEFKLLMQLPGMTNCALDRCVVKLCGPKLVGEVISAGAADEEVASRNQVQEEYKVQPIQYVDTNQLGSKKPNETRTAVVDRSTPLSRTTQRSLSLPPWAPTRRSKQMRRLSSAPRRLQGEAKQDGPPQAAAAGFEGPVSTRISGFSLVLVQAGACAAGGKVPTVAIALTRFSILGLQARAVGDTRA